MNSNKFFLVLLLIISPIILMGQHSENHHKHHIGLFLGNTNNIDAEHNSFTIALEYEYKLTKKFGVGLIAEYIAADHSETIFAIPLYYHLTPQVTVLVAQGKIKPEGLSSHNLTRFGAMYEFHVGKFSVSPMINYDLIDHNNSLVYGIAVGIGF